MILLCFACVSAHGKANEVACDAFLRHKRFVCSPEWLTARGVTVYTVLQRPGDYIIIKPGVLHWGMNLGENTAEAVNFALGDHIREVTDIPGYAFTVCPTGLPEEAVEPACELGYLNGVTQIELAHIRQLSDFTFDPTPTRKAMKGRKAKEARFNPGKRHRHNNE